VTLNWSRFGSGASADPSAGLNATETMIAARERIRQARDALGPELASIALDVCCYLKGIEAVETERQWPARAGKVVLAIALSTLARHYGLSAVATGAKSGLRAWSASGSSGRHF
jgi:hypothetical protein